MKAERKKKKKVGIILLCSVLALVIIFFACREACRYKGYSGKHKDLFTVAVNSVLWNNGHSQGAEKFIDSEIEVLETDDYGRVLFTYYEMSYKPSDITYSALLVCQHSDGKFAYYYDDKNYFVKKQKDDALNPIPFSREETDSLKLSNDWGKELDLDKCCRKEITNTKKDVSSYEKKMTQKINENFNLTDDDYHLFMDYLTADKEGNFIIYGVVRRLGGYGNLLFVVLIKADESDFIFFDPDDLYDYSDEFAEFKETNGWVY